MFESHPRAKQMSDIVASPLNCPICNMPMRRYLDDVFDDRYGYPETFSLERCPQCDLIETVPPLEEGQLPMLYGQYYPRRYMDVTLLAHQVGDPGTVLARCIRWLRGTDNQGQYLTRHGDYVLDYGCGMAVSLLEIKKLGGIPYGIEADPNVAVVADRYQLPIHLGKMSEDIFPGIRFNLVVLNQVIEHIPEAGSLLKRLSDRLAVNGRIVLSFPNTASIYRHIFGRRWINWHIPYHLHHFTRKSFYKFAEKYGFHIESCRTVTPNLWTALQFQALHVQPRVGVPNPVWAPTGEPSDGTVAERKGRRIPLRLVCGLRLMWRVGIRILIVGRGLLVLILNRIVDQVGLGDSIVIILKPRNKGR